MTPVEPHVSPTLPGQCLYGDCETPALDGRAVCAGHDTATERLVSELDAGDVIACGTDTRRVVEVMVSSDHTTEAPWQACPGACCGPGGRGHPSPTLTTLWPFPRSSAHRPSPWR